MNALALSELLNALPDDMIVSAYRNVMQHPQKDAAGSVPAHTEAESVSVLPERKSGDAFIMPRWVTAAALAACLTFAAGFGIILLRGHQNDLTMQSSRDDVEEIITTSGTVTTSAVTTTASAVTAQPASETRRGIVTLTTADGSAKQDTSDTTGTTTTGTEPPAETTTALTAEQKQSEYGLIIEGVFYQKGDFNMDGVIDLRDDYEMSKLYSSMRQGGSDVYNMRSEQLALGDIVDWAPMKTEYTGLDRTNLLPFDINDTGMLRRYVCVHHIDSSVALEAFVQLSNEERDALMNDFYRQYKLVNAAVGDDVFNGEIVPLEKADGLYDSFGGTYYLCGDINMNGELDEADAELAEKIYAARGDEFPITQLLLANITRTVCRYDTNNNAYPDTEYLQITGTEKAQLIRDYIRLRDMGTALPESLYDFYDQREAGAYEAQLKQ